MIRRSFLASLGAALAAPLASFGAVSRRAEVDVAVRCYEFTETYYRDSPLAVDTDDMARRLSAVIWKSNLKSFRGIEPGGCCLVSYVGIPTDDGRYAMTFGFAITSEPLPRGDFNVLGIGS